MKVVKWRLQKWLKEISITKVVGDGYKSGDVKNYKTGRIHYKSGDLYYKNGRTNHKSGDLLQKW